MSLFRSREEFHRTFDALFDLLSTDPGVGPALRATRTRQRYVFPDFGTTLDVRESDDKRAATGQNLYWTWDGKRVTWRPDVVLELTSETANRYFQGKENVPLALARKRIVVTDGDVAKILDLLPIVLPFHTKWVAHLKTAGPEHLLV